MTLKDRTEAARARDECGPGGIWTLDVASLTGCAYGQIGAEPTWWSERHSGSGAGHGALFARFEIWFEHALKILAPRRIYAEMAFTNPKFPGVGRMLLGYRALMAKCCFTHDRWLSFVAPQKITAFFTGDGGMHGQVKKDVTIATCREYGWKTYSDDEADALALFVFAEHDIDAAAHKGRKERLCLTTESKSPPKSAR